MTNATAEWCPRCRRPTRDVDRCPTCGLPQVGPEADRLRQIAVRLYQIGTEQSALAAETGRLYGEQAHLFTVLDGGPPIRPTAGMATGAAPARFEWRWEVVRDLLLWLGTGLVGAAALIFAAVAWRRLGDPGRAGLLLAATVVAATGAALTRRRLPATAQALSGLAVLLTLIDWYVLRLAGVASGWSGTGWWALGTALVAVGAGLVARWFPVQRLSVVVLGQVAAVLAVSHLAGGAGQVGLALALVAAVATTLGLELRRRASWRYPAWVLLAGSGLMLCAAAVAVVVLLPADTAQSALSPAAVLLAMGLAPAGARWRLRAEEAQATAVADGLVVACAASVVAAATILCSARWDGATLLAPVALLGLATFVAGRVSPVALQRGVQVAGGATMALAALGVTGEVARSLLAPLSWAGDPWSTTLGADAVRNLTPPPVDLDESGFGIAVVVLDTLAAAAALCFVRLPGKCLIPPPYAAGVLAVAGTGAAAALPLALAWPIGAACAAVGLAGAASLVVAVQGNRRWSSPVTIALVAAGAVLATTATGWSLAVEAATLVWLAVLILTAGVAAAIAAPSPLRLGFVGVAAAAALAEVAAVSASAGGNIAQVGLAVTVAGGALVAAGAHSLPVRSRRERGVVELSGVVGLGVGTGLAAATEPWLALSLTIAVAWLALAGASSTSRWHLWAAGWVAVAATWAWLAAADVTVVEAYTLPPAAAALICGAIAQRRSPHLRSWVTWAPGLVLVLLPTLALSLSEPGLVRRLAVTAAGLIVVVAGARTQRQAPLVLGSVTLVTMALDALVPVATELPRWATIGAVGLLLLWMGATAERRMAQLRRLRQRFEALEPEARSPFAGPPRPHPPGGTRAT